MSFDEAGDDPRFAVPSFTLRILQQASPVHVPRPGDQTVTEWRNRVGMLGALSHIHDGQHWLHVINVASFRLDIEHLEVVAYPLSGVQEAAVEDEFLRTAWPAALQLKGFEVLHASAIVTPQGVVAFCAQSETGKSTIAYGLQRRGFRLWSDDSVLLDIYPDKVDALALPFKVRLRAASVEHFGLTDEDNRGSSGQIINPSCGDRLPLAKIFVVERSGPGDDFVTIARAAPAAMLARLTEHVIYFSLASPARKRQMLVNYLRVLEVVPTSTLKFRPGLHELENVLDGIEALLQ